MKEITKQEFEDIMKEVNERFKKRNDTGRTIKIITCTECLAFKNMMKIFEEEIKRNIAQLGRAVR